jgi:hypothetical protein
MQSNPRNRYMSMKPPAATATRRAAICEMLGTAMTGAAGLVLLVLLSLASLAYVAFGGLFAETSALEAQASIATLTALAADSRGVRRDNHSQSSMEA